MDKLFGRGNVKMAQYPGYGMLQLATFGQICSERGQECASFERDKEHEQA